MLIRLQSPRTHKAGAMAKIGTPSFGIAGNPWDQHRKIRYSNQGLELEVDESPRNSQSSYLVDGGLVVWLGNEDLDLIRGSGEVRRRYLDFLGAQIDPAYRLAWSRYRRALRAKNALLKESRPRDAEIASYEEILIEHGETLTSIRSQLIKELSPSTSNVQQTISGKDEPLTLRYLPGSGASLRESMLQAREREIRLRQAIIGPHRDDFELRLYGSPASEFASEGQQRTIALALKIAQGHLLERRGGKAPIYLLDDIFGELDPNRRNALMQCLPPKAQKWITTTHLDWLKETPALELLARYTVTNGIVS